MGHLKVLAFALSIAVGASAQTSLRADLNKPFPMKTGHLYALSLQQSALAFMGAANWDAPLLATYDEGTSMIQVDILGSRSDIDAVNGSVDEFREKILAPSLNFLNQGLSTNVDESGIRILYTNREKWKEILVWEKGAYTLR